MNGASLVYVDQNPWPLLMHVNFHWLMLMRRGSISYSISVTGKLMESFDTRRMSSREEVELNRRGSCMQPLRSVSSGWRL